MSSAHYQKMFAVFVLVLFTGGITMVARSADVYAALGGSFMIAMGILIAISLTVELLDPMDRW